MPTKRRPSAPFQRVLLKLSGELLASPAGDPLDPNGLGVVAGQVEGAIGAGVQMGVVLGGGNILRGSRDLGKAFPRTVSDSIGMIGTLVNALALQAELDRRGIGSRVLSATEVPSVAELHTPHRARRILENGEVVLFAGGTGNPYFTTDTAAALRALEIGCGLLIKATKVDGVYSDDPERNREAQLFRSLTYEEVLARKLEVMDLTAITLCMENRLPVVVLNAKREGSVRRFLDGEALGTLILPEGEDPDQIRQRRSR
ncbi:MAG: UMP kinase [Candidatus Eisenbacteria sp.]|nr:UMP kinase [Candidatus Eisenbacteria bacterium]